MISVAIIYDDAAQYLPLLAESMDGIQAIPHEVFLVAPEGQSVPEMMLNGMPVPVYAARGTKPALYNAAMAHARFAHVLFCKADVVFAQGFFAALARRPFAENTVYLAKQNWLGRIGGSLLSWDYMQDQLCYTPGKFSACRREELYRILEFSESCWLSPRRENFFDERFSQSLFEQAAVLSCGCPIELLEECEVFHRDTDYLEKIVSREKDCAVFVQSYPLLTETYRHGGALRASALLAAERENRERLQRELANKTAHIEQLLQSERELKSQANRAQQRALEFYEKDTVIFNQQNRINELESWVAILRARSDVLDQVYASRTWRYTHKMVSIVRRVFPAETRRGRMLTAVLRAPIRWEHGVRGFLQKRRAARARRQTFRRMEPILFPYAEEPLVSIIIPVYNQFDYTIRCLKSILSTCQDMRYEVILADDNSSDDTRRIAEKVKGITIVRNEENLRFLRNCCHAAEQARGSYLLFLNNDTEVHENWLQSLVALMERRLDCGMAGSKLLFADGRLQEAGGIVWSNGTAWNYGRGDDPEKSEYNYVKEVDYISGCSIMIRTELWKRIGGFDKRFAPAYCEDSDLAFAVRAQGYCVLYQPESVVTHYEGVSNGTDTNSGQKQYQVRNQEKLREKWQAELRANALEEAQNVFWARDRSQKKKCLLVVDHYVPTYDQDAGSRTVFEYLKLFLQMGFQVKFIPDNFNRSEYTPALQQLGIEVLYGPWYAQHWQEWVRANSAYIDFVFLNRPHISVKYIDFLRENTHAKIIYYGHDLHFLRETRQYELTKEPELLDSIEKWKAIELYLMRKADMTYYPSYVEEAFIHAIDADIRVKAIPAYIYPEVKAPRYCMEERRDIMFIGGFGHTPNVDAVQWLAQEIWPRIKKQNPSLRIHILGSHPPKELVQMDAPDFHICGFVSDAELQQFYASCRISIVPLRYGAGIKGKVIEAMEFGIPVVTTSVGAEGIAEAENILAIEDDAQAFAQRVAALYHDEEALCRMSSQGCAYIQSHFGTENARNTIREDFV